MTTATLTAPTVPLATTTLVPCVVPARTGDFAELGDHRGHILLRAQDTGGAFALFECAADTNGGTPPHIHWREEETFYIQEGRFAFQIGDQTGEAGPGDCLFGPRGIAHSWRCISADGGRLLILVTPGANFEAFARTMAESQIRPLDPESIAQLMAIAERHGIEMLPPAV